MGALYKMQICISLWCLATFSVCSGSWSRIPAPSDGVPESVTATAQYLWAIDDRMGEFITSSNNNVIYCQRPCTDGNWTDAFGQLEQIDANDGEIWGINDRSQVYRRASNTSVGEWVRVGGRGDDKCKEPLCMSDISVSRNGAYIWGVSTENATYMCQNRQDCSGNNWMLVQNSLEISIVQIDAGDEEVWGVNASNYIFKRPVNGSREWTMVPGTMRYVSASGITYIWGIAPNNSLFNCEKPCTGDWQYIGGSFRQIDGADDYVVGVTSKNHVFALSIEGNSSPLLFPQSLQVTTQGI